MLKTPWDFGLTVNLLFQLNPRPYDFPNDQGNEHTFNHWSPYIWLYQINPGPPQKVEKERNSVRVSRIKPGVKSIHKRLVVSSHHFLLNPQATRQFSPENAWIQRPGRGERRDVAAPESDSFCFQICCRWNKQIYYPLVNIQKNYWKSQFLMGKLTINGHFQ